MLDLKILERKMGNLEAIAETLSVYQAECGGVLGVRNFGKIDKLKYMKTSIYLL